MRLVTVVGGLFLLAAAPLAGDETITMSVSPAMSVEPATITVRILVEPNADNAAIDVVAESADFYRSSEITLDGAHAARTTTLEYRDLPAGEYEIRGTLVGRRGQTRAIVRRDINVMP